MEEKELEIVFVRHAQSRQNIGETAPGFHPDDAPLTELGLRQAALLAKRFSPGELDAIYAGTLIRTCQTVQPTAEKLGLPIRVVPELMEVGTAVCGTSLSHVEALAPAALESAREVLPARRTYSLANESETHCAERAQTVLALLQSLHPGGAKILVATHGAFFGYLVRGALGLSLPEPFAWEVSNCAVTDVRFCSHDKPRLVCSNDQRHFYMV